MIRKLRRQRETVVPEDVMDKAMLNSLADGICTIELVLSEDGRVNDLRYTRVNKAFEEHSGIADIEGRYASEAIPKLERHWFDHFQEVYHTGKTKRFVDEASASLNRWFEVTVSRHGSKATKQLICVFREVSDRIGKEKNIHTFVGTLAEQDRRKSEFIATLAHEIRHPLMPLQQSIEIARNDTCTETERSELLSVINTQVKQITKLVADMEDVALVSRGELTLNLSTLSLQSCITEALLYVTDSSTNALAIEQNCPDETVWVTGDKLRVTQAITNLLSNAIRYSEKGSPVRIDLSEGKGTAMLTVRDKGVGLTEQEQEDIFLLYSQINGPVKSSIRGMGIGLTLTRRLLEAQSGSVEVYSEGRGKGSQFTITLPSCDSVGDEKVIEDIEHTVSRGSKRHVIVVEDDDVTASTLELLFKKMNHTVTVVGEGALCIEAVKQHNPDFVLVDISLPDMSGHEVALMLGNLPGREKYKLVALTGWGTKDDVELSLQAGFDQHITKPATVQQLRELVIE